MHTFKIRHYRFRALLLIGCIITALLICRVVYTMLIMGPVLRERADNNRFYSRPLIPSRGVIFDRNHVPLALNSPTYERIEGDPTAINPKVSVIDEHTAFSLLLHDPEHLIQTQQRYFPFGPALAHVVGYVGYIAQDSQGAYLSLEQKVGKMGAERMADAALRGTFGTQQFERNAVGKLTRLAHTQDPVVGDDLTLSIDSVLSKTSFDLLQGKKGAIVVSDVATGQVLVMVSSPSFIPSDIVPALTDTSTPLLNRALQSYPPGSVFKMITALAALKNGSITKDTLLLDEGEIKVGQASFRNWYFTSYGRTEGDITVVKALGRSNDVFFYKAAAGVGPDGIAAVAKAFHFGDKTNIGLSGEASGVIPTPAWKEKTIGEKWYLGDTYHMGIGQGDVLVSPLQLNSMTMALARRGEWCKPLLRLTDPTSCGDTGISKSDIETVIEGMVAACSPGGTAFPFFAYNQSAHPEDMIACKTGTAEHGAQDEHGRRSTHAWLTLFYPRNKPRVAITVLLESNGDTQFLEGSADAAPIAKAVWQAWLSSEKK